MASEKGEKTWFYADTTRCDRLPYYEKSIDIETNILLSHGLHGSEQRSIRTGKIKDNW